MSKKLEEMAAFFNQRSQTYDEVHVQGIDGGIESKNRIAGLLPEAAETLLDLGIGTGLELEQIWRRFPPIQITGIDFAEDMLRQLRNKYPDRQVQLLPMSYFDYEFPQDTFDAAISVMTLHHYTHSVKTELYRKILRTLKEGGCYIESDYMITGSDGMDPQAMEDWLFSEYERLKQEQNLQSKKEYHFDTPCTVENQKKMLAQAGFSRVEEKWKMNHTVILRAWK